MKRIILFILFAPLSLWGQTITGTVENEQGEKLFGATLRWEGTSIGAVVQEDGTFEIEALPTTAHLVVDYVGYEPIHIEVGPTETVLEIVIEGVSELMTVEVAAKRRDNFVSTISTLNVETISSNELRKAACCSLAESFETNGAVDVSYSDAVTGAKEIKMLGLRGLYTQLLTEKRPSLGGLGGMFALEYLPGTWIESIQIGKGAGSVQNGYNSIAGQINTELVKPWEDHPVFVNLYGNTLSRGEVNIHLNKAINEQWSTGLLMHGSINRNNQDRDPDGFYDLPQKQTVNALYRLFYRGENLRAQFNVHALQDERFSGQVSNPQLLPGDLYQVSQQARRVEGFGKVGYLGFKNPEQSLGFIWNVGYHETNDFFGDRIHRGDQKNAYFNLIYTTPLGQKDHVLNAGASYLYDDYREELDDLLIDRLEQVPGVFAEYSFAPEAVAGSWWRRWNVVAGMRVDFHNLFGTLVSPRLNLKYKFTDDAVVRLSGGRGYRTPNVIAENLGLLVSNRDIRMEDNLPMEQAWNYGINYVQNFKLLDREFTLALDLYRTDFVDQIIIDREEDPTLIWFYPLEGKSFANSLLAMLQVTPADGLDFKFVYKYNDVQMTFVHGFHDMPLVVPHRGLVTADYETANKKWMFNLSSPIVGSTRLPDNTRIPDELLENHPVNTPVYALVNAQITRRFDTWELYVGGENLTDYRQEFPIISYDDPSNPYFDAAQVYAPTVGARGYVGLRWWLDKR